MKSFQLLLIILWLSYGLVAQAGYLDGPDPAARCPRGNDNEACLKKAGAMRSDGDPTLKCWKSLGCLDHWGTSLREPKQVFPWHYHTAVVVSKICNLKLNQKYWNEVKETTVTTQSELNQGVNEWIEFLKSENINPFTISGLVKAGMLTISGNNNKEFCRWIKINPSSMQKHKLDGGLFEMKKYWRR